MDLYLSDELAEFANTNEFIKDFWDGIVRQSEQYLFPLKDSFVWECNNGLADVFNMKQEQYELHRKALEPIPDFSVVFMYSTNKGKDFYFACMLEELSDI